MITRLRAAKSKLESLFGQSHLGLFILLALILMMSGDSARYGLAKTAPLSEEWPQWRGPQRNGLSSEKGLLQRWPQNGPSLVFKAAGLGTGFSSLSISQGKIFTMGDLGEDQYVMALRQSNGQQMWKTKVGPAHKDGYGGPRSTPTVDGDRIYLVTTEGDVLCLAAASGRVRWRKSLPRDFGGKMMTVQNDKGTFNWKYSESPLLDGDKVMVTPGANNAAMVALNKMTGAEIWRAKIPNLGSKGADGAGYSSAVISEAGGIRQYVQLIGRGAIGVEAKTGRFLWGYNKIANETANIPTPIIQGDQVFVSTGYSTGAALLKLSRAGDGIKAEEVYFLQARTLQNHHGGLVILDGYLYTGTGHSRGFPICVKLQTGQVAWGPARNAGQDSAAVIYADGHLYFRYTSGLMVLIEATPQEYREKGSFMIPNVEQPSWSHPVIADRKLYLREQDNLFVYDISAH